MGMKKHNRNLDTHKRSLRGYSLETLICLRRDLEKSFAAGKLDRWGGERLVACKEVIQEKTEP